MYEGLDQKVRPKKRHANASTAVNTASAALNRLATNTQATNRLKNNLVGYEKVFIIFGLPFYCFTFFVLPFFFTCRIFRF